MRPSELQLSFLVSFALVAWMPWTLECALMVASWSRNFIALLALVRWDASDACQFLHRHILPPSVKLLAHLWDVLELLLQPPYLYVVLNLLLITIAMTSGILSKPSQKAKFSLSIPSKMHQTRPSKESLREFGTWRSGDSHRVKQRRIADQDRDWSFLNLRPSEVDQSILCDLGRPEEFAGAFGSVKPLFYSSVRDQEMRVQKAAPFSYLALVERPFRNLEKRFWSDGEDYASRRSDEQRVQISHEEISTEELFHRAEAYIRKVRTSWWLQSKVQAGD